MTALRPFKGATISNRYTTLRDATELTVNASHIAWQLDDDVHDMLPVMKTDLTLSQGNRVLIIDAKYYSTATQKHFGTPTLHSANLYQIFTYVKNKEAGLAALPHEVSGMLLYAKTEEGPAPHNDYRMSSNRISVRSLDLNTDFVAIRKQLDDIVRDFFPPAQIGEMSSLQHSCPLASET